MKPTRSTESVPESSTICYTFGTGTKPVAKECKQEQALAKKISTENKTTIYYVAQDGRNRPLNPLSTLPITNADNKIRELKPFIKTTKEVFELYLKFLGTKNQLYFKKALGVFLDG